MKKNKMKYMLKKVWTTVLGGGLILALTGCSMMGAVKDRGTAESDGETSSYSTTGQTIEENSEVSVSQTEDGAIEIVTESSTVVVEDTTVSEEALAEDETASEYFTSRDVSGTYDEEGAVTIILSGTGGTVEGAGAGVVSVEDGLVTIKAEGVYILSGDFEGQILVSVEDTEKVQLVLNGVDLYCEDNAAIYVENADKTFITLAAGSQNSVSTGDAFALESGETEPDAAIFSKDDLVVNGSGSLSVTTGYMDGIASKDDLKICGGMITVVAQDDGIRGKDSVRISGGVLQITAKAGHAVKSTNDTEEGKGYIYLCGGTLVLNSAQDGLHAYGNIIIDGGNMTVTALDDGIHTDSILTINGGVVNVQSSYEGLEGYNIIINGGDIVVNASDDGLNAAGGTDTAGTYAQDYFNTSSASAVIVEINGGTLTVTANGDGLDSNGSLYMNGGTVYVNGPWSGGNGSMDIGDWNCEAVITGGSIITAGTSDMAVNFGSTSTQPSLLVGLGTNYSAGTTVELRDSSGNTLLSYQPSVTFSCVLFSCEAMEVGETYTIYLDGAEYTSITMTSTSVSSGAGGFGGGFGGQPGGQQGGGFGGQPGGQQGSQPGGQQGGPGGRP